MSSLAANAVAIVTWAARGIGQSVAETLAANGARVVINYAHNVRAADEIVQRIQHNGGQALAVQADISKVADLTALFQATIERFGQVDILVNNASVMTTKPIEDITEQDFDHEYATKRHLFCLPNGG